MLHNKNDIAALPMEDHKVTPRQLIEFKLYLTVQNKVTDSETPQGTVQEHSLGYIDPFS